MKRFIVLAASVALFVTLATQAEDKKPEKPASELFKSSVQIHVPEGNGSGFTVTNGDRTLIWTAGHVVRSCQYAVEALDPATGKPRIYIKYRDPIIRVDDMQDGRKVGWKEYYASVIRFSDSTLDGEDLALLTLHKKDAGFASVSFSEGMPDVGTEFWLMGGNAATHPHSFAQGMISANGRLIGRGIPNSPFPKLFDQVVVSALAGCSGSGVFNKKDLKCLGMLTAGVDGSETVNLIVPTRRIREYAKRAECEWAVDNTKKLPADLAPLNVVTDRPIPTSAFKKEPATPPKKKD